MFVRRSVDVVGRPVAELVPDQPADEVARALAALAAQREVTPRIRAIRRPDGEVLDLLVTAVPLVGTEGETVGLTVLTRDLTALRRSEAALAMSEARYRTLVETAYEGMSMLDADQRVIFANSRLADMLGYSVDELTNLPRSAIVFPEDAPELARMLLRRRRGVSEQVEVRFRRRDGTELWVLMAASPLWDEGGRFAGSFACFTDLTERKRDERALATSEATLRAYFEHVPAGIVLVGLDEHIEAANPAASTITGYQSQDLLGAHLATLTGATGPEGTDEIRRRIAPVLRGEAASVAFEQPFTTKAGGQIWLDVAVSLIGDGLRARKRIILVLQDATARKEAERVKDEFVSVASHELRTPLTSIRGALGLLAGGAVGTLEEPARRMLEIALQSTDRLIRLINDMLDLERLTTGKLPLSLQACELAPLVSRAVEELRGAADAARVEIRAGELAGRVWADPDRVLQALTNLLGNAIKYSPPGGTVRVSAEHREDEVCVSVAENGPGIPPAHLQTIFERFHQVDSSDSRAKGGTGLGLAITRSIVAQHGGHIWAESVVGEGATFRFTLPALASTPDDPETRGSDLEALVCDPDAGVREAVKAALEASSYRVWTAASGEEALTIARVRQPDVILLDLSLPGTAGRETASALRSQPETADIPIVVLSALASAEEGTESERSASPAGRPVRTDALLAALRDALGRGAHHALVVEDDPLLGEVLRAELVRRGLEVRRAGSRAEALRLGRALRPDLLLLDLALPDGDGIGIVEWLRDQHWASTVPVLVYSAFDLGKEDRARVCIGETRVLTKGRTSPAVFEAELDELLEWVERRSAPR